MTTRPLFVANWKLNRTRSEALEYARRLGERIESARISVPELCVAPPFTAFDQARDPASRWSVGAQNVAAHRSGAFTGEVSAGMLADAGCRYVIVGHSERRRLFGETPETLAEKLARVREAGLLPIYCIGETQEERSDGLTDAILGTQIQTLVGDPHDAPLVVAYEPVWAIGSGTPATPADAARCAETVRRLLARRTPAPRILYGGSVTPQNCRELMEETGMEGFLIGGASLDPDTYADIAGL